VRRHDQGDKTFNGIDACMLLRWQERSARKPAAALSEKPDVVKMRRKERLLAAGICLLLLLVVLSLVMIFLTLFLRMH